MHVRVLAIVGAVALLIGACGGDDDTPSAAATSTTEAAPATTQASGTGDEIDAEGAELRAPEDPETRQMDPELACRTFLETEDGACEIVDMAGGYAMWTAEPVPDSGVPGEPVWRLAIRVQSETLPDGGWDVALELPEALGFAAVGVAPADLTGDGRPELLVGYRSAGTGQFLAYDVVTYEPNQLPEVAARREGLSKGSLAVEGVTLVDYSAVYRAERATAVRARRCGRRSGSRIRSFA